MAIKSTVSEKENMPFSEKGNMLISGDGLVVVTSGKERENAFSGTVLNVGESSYTIGYHQDVWGKNYFRPFNGKVILESS